MRTGYKRADSPGCKGKQDRKIIEFRRGDALSGFAFYGFHFPEQVLAHVQQMDRRFVQKTTRHFRIPVQGGFNNSPRFSFTWAMLGVNAPELITSFTFLKTWPYLMFIPRL